jgi:hypothetical protein
MNSFPLKRKIEEVMDKECQWHFITTGLGTINYRNRAKMLCQEVASLGLFSHHQFFTEADLRKFTPELFIKHHSILKSYIHGFGYYLWKPYLISRYLEIMPDNCYLLYLDAGFTLAQSNTSLEELRLIQEHTVRHELTVFTSSEFIEKEWSSADLMDKIGLSETQKSTFQHLGGAVFMRNSARTRSLIHEWKDIATMESYRFLFRENFILPNDANFNRQAHDQAILSCLVKRTFTNDTLFFEGKVPIKSVHSPNALAKTRSTYPFIAARFRFGYSPDQSCMLISVMWKVVAFASRLRIAALRRLMRVLLGNA